MPIASTTLPQDPSEQCAALEGFLKELLGALTNRGLTISRIERFARPPRPATPLTTSELPAAAAKRLASLREGQADSNFRFYLEDDRGLLVLQLFRRNGEYDVSLYAHDISDVDATELARLRGERRELR